MRSNDAQIKRPRLLCEAARYVAQRKKFRKRSFEAIRDEEAELERMRKAGDYSYSAKQHIMVLGEYIRALT